MTRVLLVSGHLVDRPGRPSPRFPQAAVGRVTGEMSAVFDEWAIGPHSTLICGGARGADIIGAELGLRRRATVKLRLALPPEEFARESVHLPGTSWLDRFTSLLPRVEVEVLPAGEPAAGASVFALANAWMIETARRIDGSPRAVVVWDGRPGDAPGGTADFVERLGYSPGDPRLRLIDPTTVRPRAS
ncbi:hypothetical protein [Nonomuraea sp. NPDC050783]|uniref:hypothetical protein n=1 Tax=Nonomuraea sp. NPDC050783 TaxID=3154634 RepID=UPI0034653EAD